MHDKCPVEHEGYGWIAGDIHVFPCHSSKASKPCRRELIDPHESCTGCAAGIPVKNLGYLPLWRWDGRGVFVVLQDAMIDQAQGIKLHRYVEWGRLEGRGEGVWVREHRQDRRWETTIIDKRCSQDLCHFLSHVLWHMPEIESCLRDWLKGDSDTGVSSPLRPHEAGALAEQIQDKARDELRHVMRRTFVVKPDPALIGDVVQAPEPTRNGRHPKR